MIERLRILKDNQVIDELVYQDCVHLHEQFYKGYHHLNSYTVLMTHLAMSMQRVKQGNVVNSIEGFMMDEMKTSEYFELAKQMVEGALSLVHVPYPTSEIEYLWLHTINLLTERGNV